MKGDVDLENCFLQYSKCVLFTSALKGFLDSEGSFNIPFDRLSAA